MQKPNRIADSTTSLTDSIRQYREIHGRTFQNSRTAEYWYVKQSSPGKLTDDPGQGPER
jgi:hypothetical protein